MAVTLDQLLAFVVAFGIDGFWFVETNPLLIQGRRSRPGLLKP